jgi:hypothetical protein
MVMGLTGDINAYAGYFVNGNIYHKPNASGVNHARTSTGLGTTFSGWHYFVTRRNGNGNDVDFFVDGVKKTTAYNGTIPNNPFTPDLIGMRGDIFYDYDGKLDEVGFWDRAITDDEVAELWNGGAGIEIGVAAEAAQKIAGIFGIGKLGLR